MRDGREVRQELLMTVPTERDLADFAKLLIHIAEKLIRGGSAVLRGDVISLDERIVADSAAEDIYSSIPVVFPEGIATLNDSSPPTVFVWLLPLMPSEATFVRGSGWSAFEDRLEAANPDLFDLRRSSII
jgi:hypothetical protein